MGIAWTTTAAPGDRLDWPGIRDRLDLATVVAGLLGPPARRIGSRLAWLCPFHGDHNPSFTVDAKGWRCWACGVGGDAVELVKRLEPTLSFREAVRRVADLAGVAVPSVPARRSVRSAATPPGRPAERPPGEPSGLPPALVDEAAERLWTPEGREALAYLTGRGLTHETIKAARLGWTPGVMLPTADGLRTWRASGVVIPWLDGDRLCLVKIRQPDGAKPKYAQAYADRPTVYPSLAAIRPGLPLVACEGELDALLLSQELEDLASVVTLGSASSRPEGSVWLSILRCPRWYAAHDADPAGDRAAAEWPARAVRVRPPAGKDWTDARQAGIDLRRWWVEAHFPAEFDREERAAIVEFDAGMPREAAELAAGVTEPFKETI